MAYACEVESQPSPIRVDHISPRSNPGDDDDDDDDAGRQQESQFVLPS